MIGDPWVEAVLVRGTAVLAIALACDALAARGGIAPAWRHALCVAALFFAALAPMVELLGPGPLPLFADPRWHEPVPVAELLAADALTVTELRPTTTWWSGAAPWVLWGWAWGGALVVAHLVAQLLMLERLRRRSTPAPRALRRLAARLAPSGSAVTVRVAEGLRSPIAFGVLRPMVLVPPAAGRWPLRQAAWVLRHEFAHLARRDDVSNVVVRLACAVLWFHPAAWVLARRVVHLRERAADERAVRDPTDRLAYADALVAMARRSRRARPGLAPAIAHDLDRRVRALLTPVRVATSRRNAWARSALWLLLPGFAAVATIDAGGTPAVSPAEEASLMAELGAEDPAARERALLRLGELAERRTFYEVVRRVRDPDPGVRAAAVWALARIGCVPAYVVVSTCLDDEDPRVRRLAALSLSRFTTPMPHFSMDLHAIEMTRTMQRFSGITLDSVLDSIGTPLAVTPAQQLERRLSDPDPSVREAARRAWVRIDAAR